MHKKPHTPFYVGYIYSSMLQRLFSKIMIDFFGTNEKLHQPFHADIIIYESLKLDAVLSNLC